MSNRNDEMQESWQADSGGLVIQEKERTVDTMENDDDFAETMTLESQALASDNVGGSSVEIDAEQLLAEVEAEAAHGVDASGRVRKRLEAIMERKRRHAELIDFDEYDLDS